MPRKVDRPHAGGRWTRARFWGFIRSALRLASRKWPPRAAALVAARRPYVGPNTRQKWEFRCAVCGGWFAGKDVEVDHVEACGQLRSFDDLPVFCRRLFCEVDGLRVLCKRECHARHRGRMADGRD